MSALKGFKLHAKDGSLGTVDDFLFDDATWKVRWTVVETGGGWLKERKILIHPSAVISTDLEAREIHLALTKAQVQGSPDVRKDRPVSQQMQNDLYAYYGWNGGLFGDGMYGGMAGIATPIMSHAPFGARARRNRASPRVATRPLR